MIVDVDRRSEICLCQTLADAADRFTRGCGVYDLRNWSWFLGKQRESGACSLAVGGDGRVLVSTMRMPWRKGVWVGKQARIGWVPLSTLTINTTCVNP